jgi:ribonucleoside-triphosphate reductase|tara:strand:+ start:4037 stop:5902 length:1866 start_codon:yes stop_codon:yes gene_type:complete
MFKNQVSEFIYKRTYSRWIEEENRREDWPETIERFISFIISERPDIPEKTVNKIRKYMSEFAVMPSMRFLWAAGPAAKFDNTCIYNCSFAKINTVEAFAECLYILMCGTGFGFSVEKEEVDKLPVIPVIKSGRGLDTIPIFDSKAGWADSVKMLMNNLYDGQNIYFDYSLIRLEGARLNTMGGRASGPAPLIKLHDFIRETMHNAQGRKLTTLEAHDICNQIAEIVVVGGVRRSSQISLSDINDKDMRHAKEWPFPIKRAMANNSAIFREKPTAAEFLKEWAALALSGTGERGIFNLDAAQKKAPSRRYAPLIQGTNPCGEIMLRDMEFCNLSEVVVRAEDDLDTLLDKVETATWLGVIQSSFTYFPYLRDSWKKNCDVEALLGVSLTGQMDNPSVLTSDALKALKSRVLRISRKASTILGTKMPAATTCVKPSGTVSQLVDSASGVHPRYSQHYIRRYRISANDPLFRLMKDSGIKATPEVGQDKDTASTWVLEFPVKSPENCITRKDVTALDQLKHYKNLQHNWCEHNASMTVYVRDDEWFEVGNWVYQNWDIINGVSFLPYDGGHYKLAPYEEIDARTYERLIKKLPVINYTDLSQYENSDNTQGKAEYACVGDKCEI